MSLIEGDPNLTEAYLTSLYSITAGLRTFDEIESAGFSPVQELIDLIKIKNTNDFSATPRKFQFKINSLIVFLSESETIYEEGFHRKDLLDTLGYVPLDDWNKDELKQFIRELRSDSVDFISTFPYEEMSYYWKEENIIDPIDLVELASLSWVYEKQEIQYFFEQANNIYTILNNKRELTPIEKLKWFDIQSEVALWSSGYKYERMDRYVKNRNMATSIINLHNLWDEKESTIAGIKEPSEEILQQNVELSSEIVKNIALLIKKMSPGGIDTMLSFVSQKLGFERAEDFLLSQIELIDNFLIDNMAHIDYDSGEAFIGAVRVNINLFLLSPLIDDKTKERYKDWASHIKNRLLGKLVSEGKMDKEDSEWIDSSFFDTDLDI